MQKTYDAILLLGLKLNPDGSAAAELNARVELAQRLYIKGCAPLIVACGGQTPGTPCTEASVMRDRLVALNVPSECVLMEDRSQVTVENIGNARALLASRGKANAKKPRVLVVTSDYHVFRARYMARTMGFRADGAGCQTPNDALKKRRRKLERMYFINYFMGWETGRRKRPAFYDRVVRSIKRG